MLVGCKVDETANMSTDNPSLDALIKTVNDKRNVYQYVIIIIILNKATAMIIQYLYSFNFKTLSVKVFSGYLFSSLVIWLIFLIW